MRLGCWSQDNAMDHVHVIPSFPVFSRLLIKLKAVIYVVIHCRGAYKSLARPGRKQALKHVTDARDFNNIRTRAIIKSSSSSSLQGKAPKEFHVILTEILACFLPGRATDLSLIRISWKNNLPKIHSTVRHYSDKFHTVYITTMYRCSVNDAAQRPTSYDYSLLQTCSHNHNLKISYGQF